MQLTRFTDLSLRLLLYLAGREQPERATVTARAAAEMFNVPYTHLVKVVHQLGRSGLLATTKGKGGGLRLARTPESIRIGEVVRLTEPKGSVIDCWTQPCPLRGACTLKHALDEALETFYISLDRYTLADMAEMPALQALVQLIA
jgi:Rrf2 family nitric oxide-sensitive transcriptional repressor